MNAQGFFKKSTEMLLNLSSDRRWSDIQSFTLISVMLIGALWSLSPHVGAVENIVLGDVNADGSIDGRDALLITQIVEGLESPTDEFIQRGDVYPIPGTANRAVGDGILTHDDARQILRFSVGLASDGGLGVDSSRDGPRFDDFEPASGTPGTRVVLIGANFAASPGDNRVYFGEIEASILEIASTRILTQVPAGATTGRIRIQTPGGSDSTDRDFLVLTERTGKLALDGNLQPSDFIITSGYAESQVAADGSFRLPVTDKSIALIGAMPKAEGNNVYLAIRLPSTTQQKAGIDETTITIDALTTAKTLVFLNPFLWTKNPGTAESIFQLMEGLPEIETLARTIAIRYPQGADGLNDREVGNAWDAAVKAVLNALPSPFVQSLNPAAFGTTNAFTNRTNGLKPLQSSSTPISSLPLPSSMNGGLSTKRLEANGAPPVIVIGIDRNFIRADYLAETHAVEPKLEPYESIFPWAAAGYSPIDWMVVLYGIDIQDMPLGINEPMVSLSRRPLAVTDYKMATVVAANQWTAKIDIVYTGVENLVNPVYGAIFGGSTLGLPFTPEGVYMLRCYSGCLYTPNTGDRGEFAAIDTIPDGAYWAHYATAVNLAIVLIDGWDLATGESKRWARAAFKKGVQNGVRKLSQELAGAHSPQSWTDSAEQALGIMLRTLIDISKAAVTALPQGALTVAQERMLSQAETVLKRANTLLTVLDKVSSAGRMGERLLGLAGYIANPYGLELAEGPTPLESILIVVGNPFNPRIRGISPTEGGRDTVVTITGDRFAKESYENQVYFESVGTTHQAEILEVRQDAIVVRVPDNLVYDRPYQILVDTPAARSPGVAPESFHFKRIPRITSISPVQGFAPPTADSGNPVGWFTGTTVRLNGSSFSPLDYRIEDIVLFGGVQIPVSGRTNTEILVQVPSMPPGRYDLYLRSPENNNFETERFTFEILGSPVLNPLSPSSYQLGDVVTLNGENFGYFGYRENPIRIEIGGQFIEPFYVLPNSLRFRMPAVGEPGVPQSIRVWNPSGVSVQREITRIPGISEARTIEFTSGWRITVNSYLAGLIPDRKISLEEAAAFARGDVDPFAQNSPWDDANIHEYQHWNEYYNSETGAAEWRKGAQTTQNETAGPGPEYRYFHNVYHYLDGRTNDAVSQANLDATPADSEEGDYIAGNKLYGGERYADRIQASGTDQDYTILGLEVGDDDDIILSSRATIDMLYSITLGNSTNLQVGAIKARTDTPIIIKGDDNTIRTHILPCQSDTAILIDTGVRNTINVTVDSCNGNGVVIQGGGGNRIYNSVITNCSLNGILVEEGESNTIESCKISLCSEDGIHIHGSHNNIVQDGESNENGGDGVVLSEANHNEFLFCDFIHNQGNGLSVFNSSHTTISYCDYFENENGIVLSGAGSGNTTIRDSQFIPIYQQGPEGERIVAPGARKPEHAIWIMDGARESLIERCFIRGTSSHGIKIEDAGSNSNSILNCALGWYNLPEDRLGGDGIRIQNGAQFTYVNGTFIGGCAGNGITIAGMDTDFTVISDCEFGRLDDSDLWYDGFVNQGWGIRIENDPFASLVSFCTFGENQLGGISVFNTRQKPGETNMAFTLEKNSLGFRQRVVLKVEDLAGPPPSWGFPIPWHLFTLKQSSGNGIDLDDAHDGHLHENWIYGYNTGIAMRATSENFIESQRVIISRNIGLLAANAQDELIRDSWFTRANNAGVELLNSEGIQFLAGSVQLATQNGMIVQSCQRIEIEDAQFGPGNGMHGFKAADSGNVTVRTSNSDENAGDGYSIANCFDFEFDRSHAQDNSGNGYTLVNCADLTMFGERPHEGLWIFNNGRYGIYTDNCKRLKIGYDRKGVNVSGYSLDGILISGSESEQIQITSSIVPNNGAIAGINGIHAIAGTGIVIGGALREEGNNVELGNQVGILIEGPETEVSILNNIIGEPEEWESGSRKYGNVVGIKLTERANHVRITNNIVNANQMTGIQLTGGAHDNFIQGNQITENGEHGVLVEGINTLGNLIAGNSISRNSLKGIALVNGGNRTIEAPTITAVNWDDFNITGTVPQVSPGSVVEIYADDDDEGLILIGKSPLFGNNFYVSGVIPPGKILHGIVMDLEGNTSEFGGIDFHEEPLDARSFTFASGPAGDREIYIGGRGLEVPIRVTNQPGDDYDPHFSEVGNQILFVSNRSGNTDLWLLESGQDEVKPITNDPGADYDPDWLAGTDRIVYVSDRDGDPDLYIASVTGTSGGGGGTSGELAYFGEWFGAYQLAAPGSIFAVHMTGTPGKLKSISYFINSRLGTFNWRVLKFENNAPTNTILAEGSTTATEFGWHTITLDNVEVPADFLVCIEFTDPNLAPGIGVASSGGYINRWWSYNPNTRQWRLDSVRPFMIKAYLESGGLSPIVHNNVVDRYPTWSPDGSKIAFSSNLDGAMRIWSVKNDGSELVRLTNGPGNDFKPAWSPDGTKIAYVSDRAGNEDIYLLDLSSANVVQLTENPAVDTDPAWNRDGTLLLFSSNRDAGFEIYGMRVGGGEARRLTLMRLDSTQPDAGPASLPTWPGVQTPRPEPNDYEPPESETPLVLSMESSHVKAGDTFTIAVQVADSMQTGNVAFNLRFDPTAFQLIDVTPTSAITHLYSAINPEFYPSNIQPVRTNWIHARGLTGEFNLVSIVLKALEESIPGEYAIGFRDAVAYDSEFNPLAIEIHDAWITLENDGTGINAWMLY